MTDIELSLAVGRLESRILEAEQQIGVLQSAVLVLQEPLLAPSIPELSERVVEMARRSCNDRNSLTKWSDLRQAILELDKLEQ